MHITCSQQLRPPASRKNKCLSRRGKSLICSELISHRLCKVHALIQKTGATRLESGGNRQLQFSNTGGWGAQSIMWPSNLDFFFQFVVKFTLLYHLSFPVDVFNNSFWKICIVFVKISLSRNSLSVTGHVWVIPFNSLRQ